MIEKSIFYIFSVIALLGASMVIISKNSVRAVLFLVLTFFATAGLWMLLEAEFLSVTLVLVYVGAVMVLFLFVVMMLDIELAALREGFTRFLPLGLFLAMLVVGSLIYSIDSTSFDFLMADDSTVSQSKLNNGQLLGTVLYTQFLYPFELAGILLLVAIVAAISLTYRGRRESKAPDPSEQIKVRKKDRVRLVKMKTEKRNS